MNMINRLPLLLEINRILHPPRSCPLTAELVRSLISKTQAPGDLILISSLANYSLLLQGLIDVERPGVGEGPVSLFVKTIADSGERKSTVSRFLERPIAEFQSRQNDEYAAKLANYEAEVEVFENKVKVLRKKISDRLKNGLSIDELELQLASLWQAAPQKPTQIQLIIEDATTEAIAHELSTGWGNAALVSDEGATILNGRIVQDLPRLNKLWSAESFTVNRKSSDSFTVTDARLTISVMAQPRAVEKFMKKRGDESRGIGFLARFLVCNPVSSQGSRFLRGTFEGDEDGYQNYLKKANEILCKVKDSAQNSGSDRKLIRFSEEAKNYWIDLYNRIESHLQINGRFEYARDHGSKLAENIARIAALLSCIEYGEDERISIDVLMDAERIAFYFSDVFLRCFESLPEYVKDANALREYFECVREDGRRYIKKNKIRQSGPPRMRDKSGLNYALDTLAKSQEVSIGIISSGMVVIDLYPNNPPDLEQWRIFCSENGISQTHQSNL
jgi:hypothetical protein